jgi:preprotein translocase subunit SecF
MLSGTYSSIFIATPVLADLKERDPQYRELAVKVKRRLAGGRAAQRAATGAGNTGAGDAPAPGTQATTVTVDEDAEIGTTVDEDAEIMGTGEPQDTDDGVSVPAAAPSGADTPPRPVSRQQRVTGSGQRRPGARKKRR